jgi:uncharacterized protein DUF2786
MADTTFRRTKEEVADKVRKLLAQAEDPAATPEEAQTFSMKAQQLMTKYAIDLALVVDAAKADRIDTAGWVLHGPYASHKVTMVSAVARANDCRAIFTDLPRGEKRIDIVGFPTDLEWVETLSRSLEIQLLGALARAMRERPEGVHGRTYAVGFVQGFISEVATRLHRARQAAVAASTAEHADAGGGSSVALVLVAKQERVDDEFRVRHPAARTVYRQVRLRSWAGYGPGRAAGRNATVARGSLQPRRGLTA